LRRIAKNNTMSSPFPTVSSAAYNSYNVLALGPCNQASEIFSRHSDSLCFGDFSGPKTAWVNFSPLGIASMQSGAPGTSSMSGPGWGVPFNNTSQPKAPLGGMYSTASQAMQNLPSLGVSPSCMGNVAIDSTLAPAVTRKSYGNYNVAINGAKSCGNMTSGVGSCMGQ